jgi:TPR repeat protein
MPGWCFASPCIRPKRQSSKKEIAFEIGEMYLEAIKLPPVGTGLEPDLQKVFDWFMKSAVAGNLRIRAIHGRLKIW